MPVRRPRPSPSESDLSCDPPSPPRAPLTAAYRTIRRVSPPEAPLEGVLAADGERRVLLVDAEAARGRVFGGRLVPPQHLLAPCDVVRRADGHDLELPWCREPLARLLDARAAQGSPLSGGELVTLAVSLLRGAREAWDGVPPEQEPLAGRWWVDDDARPLFAPSAEGAPVAAEAARLLERAATHTRDRVLLRLMSEVRVALERPRRLHRVTEELEDALFDAFAPRPLEKAEARPRALSAVLDEDPVTDDLLRPASGGVLSTAVGHFTDTAFADAVGEALDRARGGLRRITSAGGRRLPIAVGAVAAVTVVAAGLLWPTDPVPADARARAAASSAPARDATPQASPSAQPETTPGAAESAQDAGARLRAELAECAGHGDPLCETIREPGSTAVDDAALAILTAAADVQLLDDYGDVAVLRADAADGAAVLLQIVRLDGRWLLRGVQTMPQS